MEVCVHQFPIIILRRLGGFYFTLVFFILVYNSYVMDIVIVIFFNILTFFFAVITFMFAVLLAAFILGGFLIAMPFAYVIIYNLSFIIFAKLKDIRLKLQELEMLKHSNRF